MAAHKRAVLLCSALLESCGDCPDKACAYEIRRAKYVQRMVQTECRTGAAGMQRKESSLLQLLFLLWAGKHAGLDGEARRLQCMSLQVVNILPCRHSLCVRGQGCCDSVTARRSLQLERH